MHLLYATHTLAPVGALSAQIPTEGKVQRPDTRVFNTSFSVHLVLSALRGEGACLINCQTRLLHDRRQGETRRNGSHCEALRQLGQDEPAPI